MEGKTKETVSIRTLRKWAFSNCFHAEADNNDESIKSLTCKVYWNHLKISEKRLGIKI